MKKKRILSITLFATILLYQVSVKAEEEDILTGNTQMYGRLSSGVSRSATPNFFQFGDIIYNGEEQSVEKKAVGFTSVLGFYDRRGFVLENRSLSSVGSAGFYVKDEEIERLGVLEDGIPQMTAVIEDVPDWLATTEISYTIKSNQADKTDIESNEGTIPLSGEVVEPFAFAGEINMDNPNGMHGSTEEKGYYTPGTNLKQYTFSNVKLNLPAGIDVPPGKQTIDLKIKWDLVYTP